MLELSDLPTHVCWCQEPREFGGSFFVNCFFTAWLMYFLHISELWFVACRLPGPLRHLEARSLGVHNFHPSGPILKEKFKVKPWNPSTKARRPPPAVILLFMIFSHSSMPSGLDGHAKDQSQQKELLKG